VVVLLRHLLLLFDILGHIVEVTRVELAQVSHQILIDDFIADESGPQLGQFKFDRVHVQHAFRRLGLLANTRSLSIKRWGLLRPREAEYLLELARPLLLGVLHVKRLLVLGCLLRELRLLFNVDRYISCEVHDFRESLRNWLRLNLLLTRLGHVDPGGRWLLHDFFSGESRCELVEVRLAQRHPIAGLLGRVLLLLGREDRLENVLR
jgi:hypothetical protein